MCENFDLRSRKFAPIVVRVFSAKMSTLDPEEKLKFEELMIRYEQDDISGSCR